MQPRSPEVQKGGAGGGGVERELVADFGERARFFLPVGNNIRLDKAIQNKVIIEASVQEMFYSHRCSKETLMTNATKTLDTIAIFKGIATAHNSGLTALDVIKGHIETLRKGEIKMGKSIKTCEYRRQCADAYAVSFVKTAKKTRDNYVTAVVDAVNNGAEFSFSASKGKANGAKGAKGAKAGDKSASDKMMSALLNVWKLSDVAEDVLIQVETALADGSSLADALEYVLESNGVKLNKGDAE